jgi:hypothetical protein
MPAHPKSRALSKVGPVIAILLNTEKRGACSLCTPVFFSLHPSACACVQRSCLCAFAACECNQATVARMERNRVSSLTFDTTDDDGDGAPRGPAGRSPIISPSRATEQPALGRRGDEVKGAAARVAGAVRCTSKVWMRGVHIAPLCESSSSSA